MSTVRHTGRYCCADNLRLQHLSTASSICVAVTMVIIGACACTDTYHVNTMCSRHLVMQAGLRVNLAKPNSGCVVSIPTPQIMQRLD